MCPIRSLVTRWQVMNGRKRVAVESCVVKCAMPIVATGVLKFPIFKVAAVLEKWDVVFQLDAADFGKLKLSQFTTD